MTDLGCKALLWRAVWGCEGIRSGYCINETRDAPIWTLLAETMFKTIQPILIQLVNSQHTNIGNVKCMMIKQHKYRPLPSVNVSCICRDWYVADIYPYFKQCVVISSALYVLFCIYCILYNNCIFCKIIIGYTVLNDK